jgi:hypothetical protein
VSHVSIVSDRVTMASGFETAQPRFPSLRFMAALRATRDFGLDPDVAASIAARFDPRRHDLERIIDALAIALLMEGAVVLPDAV